MFKKVRGPITGGQKACFKVSTIASELQSICGTNAYYISTDDGDIGGHTVSNGGHVPTTKQD